MNKNAMTRRYDMAGRSRQAAETRTNIISATERLLATRLLDEVSLRAIAEEAGTTVQTVLRHMNSRDGCIEAVIEVVTARVEEQRGSSEYGDIDSAIADLIDHYEAEGTLVLNLLAQEHRSGALVSGLMKKGRAYHRRWVKRRFACYLHRPTVADIDALVLATDIYAWKLLRLDLGRSPNAARKVLSGIVKKILEVS